jgi:hypothetical protein
MAADGMWIKGLLDVDTGFFKQVYVEKSSPSQSGKGAYNKEIGGTPRPIRGQLTHDA